MYHLHMQIQGYYAYINIFYYKTKNMNMIVNL